LLFKEFVIRCDEAFASFNFLISVFLIPKIRNNYQIFIFWGFFLVVRILI
jgi:hypothetical protein